VQHRGWLDDRRCLSAYALSQLVPGATSVNLAVVVGAQMRGTEHGWLAPGQTVAATVVRSATGINPLILIGLGAAALLLVGQ
jgi:chromate transport protein ChrA